MPTASTGSLSSGHVIIQDLDTVAHCRLGFAKRSHRVRSISSLFKVMMGAALSSARRASFGTCYKQGVLPVILMLSIGNSEVHNTCAATVIRSEPL